MASGLSNLNVQVGDAAMKSSDMCPSKITIPGKRAPLDFTLKTSLQFVSSSSVKWWVCTSFSCISLLYSDFFSIRNHTPNKYHMSILLEPLMSVGILKIIFDK